jgi:hypothetical protein
MVSSLWFTMLNLDLHLLPRVTCILLGNRWDSLPEMKFAIQYYMLLSSTYHVLTYYLIRYTFLLAFHLHIPCFDILFDDLLLCLVFQFCNWLYLRITQVELGFCWICTVTCHDVIHWYPFIALHFITISYSSSTDSSCLAADLLINWI